MFSALKFVAATALVALLGGSLAISVTQPQASQLPGAAVSASPSAGALETQTLAAAITGRFLPVTNTHLCDIAVQSTIPESVCSDYAWTLRVATSDPRLDGTMESNQNYHQVLAGDGLSGSLRSGIGRLENDGGSWTVEFQGFSKPGESSTYSPNFVVYLTGEGGYEGLSAMLFMIPVPSSHWDVDGVIFPGPMPEPPASLYTPETE